MTEVDGALPVGDTNSKEPESNGSSAVPILDDKLVKQVEFYFGDANLPHDKFIKLESANNEGWFPVNLLLKFNKLTGMMSNVPEEERLQKIISAIQSSVLVELNEDTTKMRRNPEMPLPEGNSEKKTVYLKGFHKTETKLEQLIDHFSKYAGMERVIMRYYKEKCLLPPELPKKETEGEGKGDAGTATTTPAVPPVKASDKIAWVKKFKGSILIVFKTEEDAKAALEDISTYAGNPLMKLMQPDYTAKKKQEFQERQQLRNSKKRKTDDPEGSDAKKTKAEGEEADKEEKAEEEEVQVATGILLKLTEIPEGVTRETIKEAWAKATAVADNDDKFEITFVDFQRGDKEGVLRLANDGAATEAMTLDTLKEGTLTLGSTEEKSGAKIGAFPDEPAEKAYILKMDKDREKFKSGRRGGRGGGRGRGRGRGRGGRGGRRY